MALMTRFDIGKMRRSRVIPEPSRVPWGRLVGLGVLMGMFAGLLIGVLMAPASGRVTRSRLRRRVEEMRDQIKESAEGLEATGQSLISGAERQVRSVKRAVSRRLPGRGGAGDGGDEAKNS